jgi:hypothetical protein
MSARTTSRYTAPAPAPGPASAGKDDVAPRKAVCTPSMRVMGENRPSHGMASRESVPQAMAWSVETAPYEMVSAAMTAATPKPRRGVSAARTSPMPPKSRDSSATETNPCAKPLVWSAKSIFASRDPM